MRYSIEYKTNKNIREEDLAKLYGDAGWSLYTRDIPSLKKALWSSLDVITAWKDDTLIALIRTIGDGISVVFIQDLLVLKAFHRQGIGTTLMEKVLHKYPHVRQKSLLTGSSDWERAFYESLGFTSSDQLDCLCFMRNDI